MDRLDQFSDDSSDKESATKPEAKFSPTEVRSSQRQQFLQTISYLVGKPVKIRVFECSRVLQGKLEAVDARFEHLFLSTLQTPIGCEKNVVVRCSDVLEIETDI